MYSGRSIGKGIKKFDLKFDVGWLSGLRKINFTDGEDLRSELKGIQHKGKSLWCNGQREKVALNSDEYSLILMTNQRVR